MYNFVKLLIFISLYSADLRVIANEKPQDLIVCEQKCQQSNGKCSLTSIGSYQCIPSLKSKHLEGVDEESVIDQLRKKADERNQQPAGFQAYRLPHHPVADRGSQIYSVHHGSHNHPHKDKLHAVHHKASTHTPPVQPKEQLKHHTLQRQPEAEVKHLQREHSKPHHKASVVLGDGNNKHHDEISREYKEKHHNKEEKSKHHKGKAKSHSNEEHIVNPETEERKTTMKSTEAAGPAGEVHEHPVAPQAIESKPGMNNRHSKLREATSMADVYFLDKSVPKFKVIDSSQGKDDEIILQAKSDSESETDPPKAAAIQDQPNSSSRSSDAVPTAVFFAVVAGCSIAGLVGLVVAGVCWYRLQKNVKAASEAEYPAYGVTGPAQEKVGSPGDRKLAQSAQMYHYQHQKQQMLAMERANGELGGNGSDVDSEEENEEGDYTVYECPGLAPTGEMEVKNPLFNDDTPVGTNSHSGSNGENK